MENDKEISSKERAQPIIGKNVELENKGKKAATEQAIIPSGLNKWQHMREKYEANVLEDHSFSEQHDIEYGLWQLHYRRIEEFRTLLNDAVASAGSDAHRNDKGPGRSGLDRVAKIRSQFKTFLSEATGFYHDLMLKIRAKYGLPLEYFSNDSNNQIPMMKDGTKSLEGNKGLISCHRCLIYLGDLARYKGLYGEGDSKARDFAAASSYYMQASSLWPSNGNPHHQLALLAGYSNDELVSIYRYFRSLAVDSPFVTARDNLIIAFEKNRQNFIQLQGDVRGPTLKNAPSRVSGKGRGKRDTRPPAKDIQQENTAVKERTPKSIDPFKAFITRFVRLNGILFTRTSLETFAEVSSTVKSNLLELLPSGTEEDFNFGSGAVECRLAIVRMTAILVFTVHNVKRENENQSYADILQRSVLLQNAFTATFEFMGCIVERCSQLNDPSSSYLLPGIMVFVEWLASHPDVAIGSELEEEQLNARSFFWKNCVALLNKLLSKGYSNVNEHDEETFFSSMSKYDETEAANLALSEDFELRGFLPLYPAQTILDFSRKRPFGGDGGYNEKIARVQRTVAAGKALTNVGRVGEDGIYFDAKSKQFVIGIPPQVSNDCLPTEYISNVSLPDVSFDGKIGQVSNSKPDMAIGAEEEDEEEVIVFKPSMNEKHVGDLHKKATSAEVPASVAEVNGSFSIGHTNYHLQNALSTSMRHPTVPADSTSQQLLPSWSKWPGEHHSIMNGFTHLNMMENTSSHKDEVQDPFRVSQSVSFSVPYPNFVGGHNYSSQITKASVPAKYDTVMSIGATSEHFPAKPSSMMPPVHAKKSTVSRPVRHIGPPPGFSSVPPRATDEPLNLANLKKTENPLVPPMDDYSWLDGYQLSSSSQGIGASNSFNQAGTLTKNNGSVAAAANFPFPGKQAFVPDYQIGNQQVAAPPQQYRGQTLWDGRFFV